ncbi:MAG: DNA polymerase III subunit gamma/tau [Mycoplasmataceae bacterium]|nr:DNA polymerase III subunit gamma/tau [Mycoplasmataceae bacterium]
MQHIALYRKYRPKSFADIIGQDFIVRTLTNSIKTNKVGHAYIFAGPKGICKTTSAKIFAKSINCLNPIDGDACNKCTNCTIINNNQTTDIMELDAASNNGVEDVRNIVDGVRFLPTSLNKKVYIIDEAHMLTPAAWNAMLKTIEEAPLHVVFIFATTEMHKIPATILSRCQHFLFNRLTRQHLTKMIEDIAKIEHIKIATNAIDKLIDLADGSGRDALSTLEQMATYTDNNITLNDINNVFGLIDNQNKINLINLILEKNTQKLIKLLDEYEQNGINFAQLANDLTSLLIDKLIYKQTQDISILKHLNTQNINEINIDEKACVALINIWQEAYMKMRSTSDTRFYFEIAIFSSFKIGEEQPTITIPKKIIKQVSKTNDVPSLEQAFTTSEIKPKQTVAKVESTPVTIKQISSIEEMFHNIAYNNSKTYATKAKELIDFAQETNKPKVLSYIACASKVLVASKNGVILLFDDDVDAELLNAKNLEYDLLIELKKYFGHPIFIIGFEKNKAKEIGQKFMLYKKQGKFFAEPDIAPLKEILKANNSIEQAALEIFGEE